MLKGGSITANANFRNDSLRLNLEETSSVENMTSPESLNESISDESMIRTMLNQTPNSKSSLNNSEEEDNHTNANNNVQTCNHNSTSVKIPVDTAKDIIEDVHR